MLFVSLTFLFLFLPIVFVAYYSLMRHRNMQNAVLFFASLFFYAWGEPKFVVVLVFSIASNWLIAVLIDGCKGETAKKKVYLSINGLSNVALLIFL